MTNGNAPHCPENPSATVEGSNISLIKSGSASVGQVLAGSDINRTANVGDMSQGGHGVSLRV
eukprot:8299703-Ditylum_brightwellii.AAC.1